MLPVWGPGAVRRMGWGSAPMDCPFTCPHLQTLLSKLENVSALLLGSGKWSVPFTLRVSSLFAYGDSQVGPHSVSSHLPLHCTYVSECFVNAASVVSSKYRFLPTLHLIMPMEGFGEIGRFGK